MFRESEFLSEADGWAVDAVLNGGRTIGGRMPPVANPIRVAAARKVLEFLNELPAISLPAGLVGRTVDFVRQNQARLVVQMAQESTRPHL